MKYVSLTYTEDRLHIIAVKQDGSVLTISTTDNNRFYREIMAEGWVVAPYAENTEVAAINEGNRRIEEILGNQQDQIEALSKAVVLLLKTAKVKTTAKEKVKLDKITEAHEWASKMRRKAKKLAKELDADYKDDKKWEATPEGVKEALETLGDE